MKYKLTDETIIKYGVTLYRIQATKSFANVGKGDLGGFIAKEKNLSQNNDSWVYDNARVSGEAQVYGDARVSGEAWIYGDARVYDNARVYGDAWVSGEARVSGEAQVYGDARVSGDAWVSGEAWVYDNARVSGEAQVYGDAWVSGEAQVYGDARLMAQLSYTKGCFIGGENSQKITNITDKTGSSYWKAQYVLGDYEISPIEKTIKEKKTVTLELTDEQLEQIQTILDN
jgi:carbonic anhydrase/acetyltransferase-like protein (isoleucine patch superfamily)